MRILDARWQRLSRLDIYIFYAAKFDKNGHNSASFESIRKETSAYLELTLFANFNVIF